MAELIIFFVTFLQFEVHIISSIRKCNFKRNAQVAELVDAHGSGPCASNGVEVRVFSWAPVECFVGIVFNKINILTKRRA